MIEMADIARILNDRPRYYADPELEQKRLRAIEWLRHNSSRGWVCDHPIVRVWGAARQEEA